MYTIMSQIDGNRVDKFSVLGRWAVAAIQLGLFLQARLFKCALVLLRHLN